jgi:hypothetical protein
LTFRNFPQLFCLHRADDLFESVASTSLLPRLTIHCSASFFVIVASKLPTFIKTIFIYQSTAMDKPQKMPKVAKVKNKAPAEVQITAEQLLREAKERDLEICAPPPKQKIQDEAELADYQQRKRKTFEDNLRKDRSVSIEGDQSES